MVVDIKTPLNKSVNPQEMSENIDKVSCTNIKWLNMAKKFLTTMNTLLKVKI